MTSPTALVVTSIGHPNEALRALAGVAAEQSWHFYLIGDERSPCDFHLAGCDFFPLARQFATDLRLARGCPTRHYARKNIGYLLAARDGAAAIVETDDDNIPLQAFGNARKRHAYAPLLSEDGWVNVYQYFSDGPIWPRGLPLDAARTIAPALPSPLTADCPIQQGLTDDDPDVDAIYRLLFPFPTRFQKGIQVALGKRSWCPFNSQNTTWFRDAFPLMYLPVYCSFRMTDIWRSLVAQRIGWEYGSSVLFHDATMTQVRNAHDLTKDFADEVPGYLLNRKIASCLEALSLSPSMDDIGHNLKLCYAALAQQGTLDPRELDLLDAWLRDLEDIGLIAGIRAGE